MEDTLTIGVQKEKQLPIMMTVASAPQLAIYEKGGAGKDARRFWREEQ